MDSVATMVKKLLRLMVNHHLLMVMAALKKLHIDLLVTIFAVIIVVLNRLAKYSIKIKTSSWKLEKNNNWFSINHIL